MPPGGAAHWVKAADGTRIRIALWSGQRVGTVWFLNGRTEYIEKYGHAYSRLLGMGLNVVTLDWRGQGLSDRALPDPFIGHVDDFAKYQQDLQAMLAHPRVQAQPGPHILMGHSMGGCIGMRALVEGLSPDAAVFSAPMWGIHVNPLLRPMAELMMLVSRMGDMTRRVPQTSEKAYVLENGFKGNLLTSDKGGWDQQVAHLKAKPDLSLGGPSFEWVTQARKEAAALCNHPTLPDLPIQLFLGTAEKVVSKRAIRGLSKRLPNAKLVPCKTARHEIWMETEEVQERVWRMTRNFLHPLWND
ncbi:alpha/beta fold hydrolase [Halovulum sp. GXIMD14793]